MSAVSTSRAKKVDPLSKKTPTNPKFSHVKAVVDTGSSVTKYLENLEYVRSNYKIRKDEIFKRMKITTFVQLIIQVGEFENTQSHLGNGDTTERPDTADEEVKRIQQGNGMLHDEEEKIDTSRSTLQSVTKGFGEMDLQNQPSKPTAEEVLSSGCPYLLLDVRDDDAYKQCHIITAKNYPSAMLSRATNYDTKEMWSYKNKPGKIIVLYDEDERITPHAATVLTQRGYDNLFMLSGGMKVANKIFPEGLFTGTPSQTVTDSTKPPKEMSPANQTKFTSFDYERLETYLDESLQDNSSRLSKASSRTAHSVTSNASSKASKYPGSDQKAGKVAHPRAFKP